MTITCWDVKILNAGWKHLFLGTSGDSPSSVQPTWVNLGIKWWQTSYFLLSTQVLLQMKCPSVLVAFIVHFKFSPIQRHSGNQHRDNHIQPPSLSNYNLLTRKPETHTQFLILRTPNCSIWVSRALAFNILQTSCFPSHSPLERAVSCIVWKYSHTLQAAVLALWLHWRLARNSTVLRCRGISVLHREEWTRQP